MRYRSSLNLSIPRCFGLWVAALLISAVAWRYAYAVVIHPATMFVYSDMAAYADWAIRHFTPGYVPTFYDTVFPPGMLYYLGVLHRVDSGWQLALHAQFLLGVFTPVLVFVIALDAYGRRTAIVALGISAFYFPHVHYTGLFLAETPFTFLLALSVLLFLRGARAKGRAVVVAYSAGAGISGGLAFSFKNAFLASMLFLLAGYAVFAWRNASRWRGWVLGSTAAGLLLVLVPLALRCTRLNGRFCPGATNTSVNVLIGHYGDIGTIRWNDPNGSYMHFGSPTAGLRGYDTQVNLGWPFNDSARNLELAGAWVREHPLDALGLSFGHVAELFVGRTLWPRPPPGQVDWGAVWQGIFWLVILIPAALFLVRRRRSVLGLHKDSLPELVLCLPLVGLMVTVFFSLSEVRHRVPFDVLTIVLASAWLAGRVSRVGRGS